MADVKLIAWTHFEAPEDIPWETDADGAEALIEFAGRACYESWSKPNPKTATNAGYIDHILEVGHFSVVEHGQATFYITGSRSMTHELVRHRHFSYSQLSQRYVPSSGEVVEPQIIAEDPDLHAMFDEARLTSQYAYEVLVDRLDRKLEGQPGARKRAREAARAVLPNATETKVVMTGNLRAWRHFIDLRATEHADVEIRKVAIAVLVDLTFQFPNVFADYSLLVHDDGMITASSSNREN